MVTVLEECTTMSSVLFCVFFFLWARRLIAKDIHKETFPVYGVKCLSHKAAHIWLEKFSQGCSKVADDSRPGYAIIWEGYAYRVLGFSESTVSPFSEA
jgi:hypothetical protein